MDNHQDTPRERSHRAALVGLVLAAAAFVTCESAPPEPSGPDGAATAIQVPSLATFTDDASAPFGTFNGIEYVRHTGRFVGSTSLGEFRVPYEIVAPADPARGNGTVLFEPPHFAFGRLGRDLVFAHGFLFGNGYSYAAVGFGANGLNILDPTADDAVIGGVSVENPGSQQFGLPPDVEILIQFVNALGTEPFALQVLGVVSRRYTYGASQTAAALLETFLTPGGTGLFDLTLLHVALWRPPFAAGEFPRSEGEFTPLSDVGRVIFVESEGDQLLSDSEQFRLVAPLPDYRLYEVAGAAHLPSGAAGLPSPPFNPLDHSVVVRAAFVRGDEWIRTGREPPPSTLLESAPEGEVDPVYGFPTGIARDADLNALGGVRLPDLHVGRARFLATDPMNPGSIGLMVDLACEPLPGSDDEEPRFRNHGDYVKAFVRQVNELRRKGFLLDADAEALKEQAAESNVGAPGSCSG